ncbi:FecR domain-containing protein [Flavivirga abyssicola]|uniref:FecR family protein n=1 Tax=Flavivirga abyssicola TaxID=3063533 RepID=UPI0026DF1435|nr:FecR domain-containing protein [Flavivirga sp. MEBiC07777]WVK14157.1 FecR domain-containing protein [Flavivirga sp. MEBiC07777]
MGNSNKIKSLSEKIAASLIKNEKSNDLETSEIFDAKTKVQMLSEIKSGKHSDLLKEIDTEKDWKVLERKIQQQSRKSFKFWYYGAAATVAVLITLGLVFNKTNQDQDFSEPVIVNNNIEIGTGKATLTLEDGSDIILEKGQTYESNHVASNGEELVYKTGNQKQKANNYNILTIPRGGQFYILLSDGTKVWLNSESQLKYPVAFTEGETRQVELVYGEAYFDVSPSTQHKGSKFKVFNRSQEVEVLGTEFNIKAYKDDTSINTLLVEGKVAVSTAVENQVLVPNQQSTLNLETNTIRITTVADVYNETAWRDGIFSFENKPLKEIFKVLSRWYDMDVVIENKVKKEERFIGTFNKSNSIEDILIAIKSTNFINSYEINDKTLTIK